MSEYLPVLCFNVASCNWIQVHLVVGYREVNMGLGMLSVLAVYCREHVRGIAIWRVLGKSLVLGYFLGFILWRLPKETSLSPVCFPAFLHKQDPGLVPSVIFFPFSSVVMRQKAAQSPVAFQWILNRKVAIMGRHCKNLVQLCVFFYPSGWILHRKATAP